MDNLEILEQTTIGGVNYYLVIDKEESEDEAFIVKEVPIEGNNEESILEGVDEEEAMAVLKVFEDLLDEEVEIIK